MRIKLMSDEIELSCRRRDVDSLKTWVAEGVASACHKMVDTRNAVLKLFGRRRSPGEAQWLLLNWELVDWLRSPGSSICNWEDFWHCWHCWLVHALLIGSSYCLAAKCRYQVSASIRSLPAVVLCSGALARSKGHTLAWQRENNDPPALFDPKLNPKNPKPPIRLPIWPGFNSSFDKVDIFEIFALWYC